MQRKHKYLWIKGWQWLDYTYDGAFKKPKIKRSEKIQCGKMKRRYFKNLTKKDIRDFENNNY